MMDAPSYMPFVVAAWGVSALVLGALAADTLLRARRWRRAAQEREQDPA